MKIRFSLLTTGSLFREAYKATVTKTITTEIPWPVYATLLAAVLAALASINATRISSKTSKEVGLMSATTAREASRIAAETAREVKDTEYKNDYYKKVIDKRIKSIEQAEALVGLFAGHMRLIPSNDNCHTYFLRHLESDKHIAIIEKIKEQSIWYSHETEVALADLIKEVNEIAYYASQVRELAKNRIFVMEFPRISILKDRVAFSLNNDMQTLYDVHLFHQSKQERSLQDIQTKEATWLTKIGPNGSLVR